MFAAADEMFGGFVATKSSRRERTPSRRSPRIRAGDERRSSTARGMTETHLVTILYILIDTSMNTVAVSPRLVF
jgi:hypothetical protein